MKTPDGGVSPHQGQPVRTAGAKLASARAAMVMVHGRNAPAESILSLVQAIDTPGFAYLAPQAAGNTWYPNSFLSPIPSNEPGITSGLARNASQRISIWVPPREDVAGFSQARVSPWSTQSEARQ